MSQTAEPVLTKLSTAEMPAAEIPAGVVTAPASAPVWHARLGPDGRLPRPDTVDGKTIVWVYSNSFVVFHALACLAFAPYFFSWTGVVLALLGLYVFGTLGINLCFHRLLTHQGFVLPKWLERTFATLGVLCVQDTPAKWVAIHRLHHQYSDEQPDPHSPLVDLFWGHMGWLIWDNRQINNLNHYEKYARDVLKDPYYFWLERNQNWVWINMAHWVAFFLAGFLIEYATVPDAATAAQFGLSLVVWGVFVRTVLVWHITWSVNSLAHVWGYRNYETDENSRNNWFVGLVSNGEGWHNNHHADQRSARHGHKWWEFDLTWITIRLLELTGVAEKVVRPSHQLTNIQS
jgi:stearoyl-CoA desaturase (delta-9 desaturase)